ncbi:response regulator [Methylobacterium sp.]|uniref:response regulator n=1 Tax=Methylobacterium sp. TaxID=409 RepID=UPI00257F2CB0|nr:response regulator [Methylobacterium sp.]
MLEAMGYRVDLACDGREAVFMVQAQTYDLVLMDVEMPVMDGRTAIRQIRALAGPARTVPIIAMTAHVLPDQVAGLLAVGANDHIGKPFNRESLRALVERNLAASRRKAA